MSCAEPLSGDAPTPGAAAEATDRDPLVACGAAPATSEPAAQAVPAAPSDGVPESHRDAAPAPAGGAAEARAEAGKGGQAGTVNIAGRVCSSYEDVAEHVKQIQASADKSESGELRPQDAFFIFHLILHHPKSVEKILRPVSSVRYSTYAKFLNKCFILVHADGSQEGMSWSKSARAMFPKSGPATEVPEAAAVGEPPGEPQRGSKRRREEPAEDLAPPVAATFEPVEWVRGCILDIHGVPVHVHYHRLRDALCRFGHVRHLNLIRRSKKRREEDTPAEPGGAGGGDGAGATAPGASATPALESPGEGAKSNAGAAEADGNDEEELVVFARCRFDKPDEARAALEGIKVVESNTVENSLLAGEEEDVYWEKFNAKKKAEFEESLKGKKGKGKSRGKGPKGKGKGKGK